MIGVLTDFFKFFISSAISIWLVAEEPPTNIAEAPIFSTSFASLIEACRLEASESISGNIKADFFF